MVEMHSWKDTEVQVWVESMLREEIPHIVSFILITVDTVYSQGELRFANLVVLLVLLVVTVVLFAGIRRIKSNKARFRAAFTYYQTIQTFLITQSLLSPTILSLYIYASAVVMIQHELTPIHSPLVNGLIIAKNTVLWSFILRNEDMQFDLNFGMGVFWSFFHMFNYLHVRKEAHIQLFRSLQEVRKEQQRLQALLQAVPDGTAVITSTREVVAYNQALLAQLHLELDAFVSCKIVKLLTHLQYTQEFMERKTNQSVMDDLASFINQQGDDTSGVISLQEGIFELRIRRCHWDQTPACVIILRDITHWVDLERKAQRESAGKTALLRSVSHELRTPTNAILNFTREVLEKESLSQLGSDTLQMITSSTTFLLSIINDLLDYSRIITGNFQLTKQVCPLRSIITDCIKLVQYQCQNKGLALSMFYDSLLPEIAVIDQTRVKQVLLNLLSNALKFTLKGRIEVSALLNAQRQMRIRVKDTGIGIPKKDVGKIFRLFGKLEGNEKLNPQGCGLGLSISNHIVESLGGGQIQVQSKPGKGSIFAFDVDIGLETEGIEGEMGDPVTDLSEDEPPSVNNTLYSIADKYDQAPAQILIVDDSDFNRIIARRLIENQGFTCSEAVTGLQAVNQVRRYLELNLTYRLILMDVEMPEMDGITATREIRQLLEHREQPMIVGCSAYSSQEDREVSLQAGMDHYLEKPLQRELLYELLARVIV